MNRQEKPGLVAPIEVGGAQDGAVLEVEARLEFCRGAFDHRPAVVLLERRQVAPPQRHRAGKRRVALTDGSHFAGEAHAQAVVVLENVTERVFENPWSQGLAHLEQHRLVVKPRFWWVGIEEEPALDRRQVDRPGHRRGQFLGLGFGSLDGDPGHRPQGGDRLVAEQISGGQIQTCLVGSSGDLNTQDRVAAELEEVVMHADLRQAEHLGPDPRQCLFDVAPWSRALGLGARQRAPGKGLAVELAASIERQGLESHEGCGHHVVW